MNDAIAASYHVNEEAAEQVVDWFLRFFA